MNIRITDRDKTGANIKPNVIKEMGLTLGDTVSVPVFVIDKETNTNLTSNYIYLYGEKEWADWIEEVLPGTIAEVKVRLVFLCHKRLVHMMEDQY